MTECLVQFPTPLGVIWNACTECGESCKTLRLPTISLHNARAGDIGFSCGSGFVAGGIRLVERFQVPAPYWHYNHSFMLAGRSDNEWDVYSADANGTRKDKLSTAGTNYIIVPLEAFPRVVKDEPLDRKNVIEWAKRELGHKYGFVTDASILFTVFTPRLISIKQPNTFMCSGYMARAIEHGGGYFPDCDSDQVTPAQLLKFAADNVFGMNRRCVPIKTCEPVDWNIPRDLSVII